ncbi:MAG: DnaJ domain-containing protein [Deltaproteobacteria bacterium]|nr:DnaJ domain-containing protein [Deltaproteobacteria bacterium]
MLPFCQNLIKQLDSSDGPAPDVRRVNTACSSRGILSGLLYAEVRKVLLALNCDHDPTQDHYDVLGLPPTATTGEVKKAYRKLSMRFHPDRAPQADGTADRFLEISGAYHAIMLKSSTPLPARTTPWRKIHKNPHAKRAAQRARNKKRLFFGFFSLVSILVLLSFFIAERYHDKALTAQLYSQKTLPVSRQETTPEPRRPDTASPVEKPAAIPTMAAPPSVAVVAVDRHVAPEPTKAAETVNRIEPEKQRALPPPARKIHPLTAKNATAVKKVTTASVTRQKIMKAEPGPVTAIATTAKKNGPAPIADHEPMAQMTAEGAGKIETGQTRPAVSREHAEKIRAFNTALRINALLNQYTDLYNRKDLSRFLALFTNDATENGSPVTSLVGDYEKLFAKTKRIRLQLDNLTWHDDRDSDQNSFRVQGNFVGIYTYKNGTSPRYTGKIAFRLRTDRGNLKIASLVYSFRQK